METSINYEDLTVTVSETISYEDIIQQYELVREMHPEAPRISSLDLLDKKILLDCIREAFEQGDAQGEYAELKAAIQPGICVWLDRYAGGELHVEEEAKVETVAD